MKIAAVTHQDRNVADAAWDQQDHKAYQGQLARLGQPARLELKDRWDYKDLLDRWDQWDHGDLLGRLDLLDRLVLLARPEQPVLPAPRELPEQLGQPALPDLLAL